MPPIFSAERYFLTTDTQSVSLSHFFSRHGPISVLTRTIFSRQGLDFFRSGLFSPAKMTIFLCKQL
jgi:hypothetical protein